MPFSILISVYAKEKSEYLMQCLQSLDEQTLKADEVVLVEDGPIPVELSEVINLFKHKLNIVSVCLTCNSGLASALNEGLKRCAHELVARMDTDDIALPQRFEQQVEYMTRQMDVDVLGTAAVEIDYSGQVIGSRSVLSDHATIYQNLWACPFLHPTVMFRRSKILSVGGYDASLQRRQDYELWFRCADVGMRFANLPEHLLLYRFGPDTHAQQPPGAAWEQGVIGFRGVRMLGLPVWMAVGAFVPYVRSLFPLGVQHLIYQVMKRIDPRRRSG